LPDRRYIIRRIEHIALIGDCWRWYLLAVINVSTQRSNVALGNRFSFLGKWNLLKQVDDALTGLDPLRRLFGTYIGHFKNAIRCGMRTTPDLRNSCPFLKRRSADAFDADESVNGADLVDWFGAWRERVKEALKV